MHLRNILFFSLVGLVGCTNLFYQPTRELYYEPSEKLGLTAKDIFFSSPGGPELHGWYFESTEPGPSKELVIQFHGNAENMSSHFVSVIWLLKHGYDLFVFDYRGYGRSEGAPYPSGVNLDALAALFKAGELTGGKEKSMIVYGQSLGGAIALRALAQFPKKKWISKIVIEGSFLSYKSIGKEKLGGFWLTWPLQWMSYLLVSDQYSPRTYLDTLAGIPKLSIHASGDPIVPIRHGKDLFEEMSDPKCFWEIPVRGHTNLMNIEQGVYREPLLGFLEKDRCPGAKGESL